MDLSGQVELLQQKAIRLNGFPTHTDYFKCPNEMIGIKDREIKTNNSKIFFGSLIKNIVLYP